MAQVNYLMEKLYLIDKSLGGTAKVQEKAKQNDEFMILKDLVLQNLYFIKKKIYEKQDQSGARNVDQIKSEHEIKMRLEDSFKKLTQMNEAYRKQQKDKKYTQQDLEQKNKIYESLKTQLNSLKQLSQSSNNQVDEESLQTISDQKSKLLLNGGINKKGQVPKEIELTQDDKEIMQRWDKQSELHDQMLDNINEGLATWIQKSKQMDKAIDRTMEQIEILDKEVDKTTTTLVSTNKQLKHIISHYRQPAQFCMDILLIILLLGFVGTIYYKLK